MNTSYGLSEMVLVTPICVSRTLGWSYWNGPHYIKVVSGSQALPVPTVEKFNLVPTLQKQDCCLVKYLRDTVVWLFFLLYMLIQRMHAVLLYGY